MRPFPKGEMLPGYFRTCPKVVGMRIRDARAVNPPLRSPQLPKATAALTAKSPEVLRFGSAAAPSLARATG